MKMKKALRYLRTFGCIALLIAAVWGALNLSVLQQYQYQHDTPSGPLPLLCMAGVFALLPFAMWGLGRLFGYRLNRLKLGFLHISGKDNPRLRLGRFGYGIVLLPPRTDGTSPIAPVLMALLSILGFGVLFGLLAWIFWTTAAAQPLMLLSLVCVAFCLVRLLPRQGGMDDLSMYLALRRDPELRRAWECGFHINAALAEKKTLSEMPDEWFLTAPPANAESPFSAYLAVNTSSRMMRQDRYAEAYAMLAPVLALAPAPQTYQVLSCAILNGALCEALADLPPRCLNQLDHPSVKYMTPPAWEPRRLAAQYAHALFVAHDENAAAALLPKPDSNGPDALILQQLKDKYEGGSHAP